MRISDWSSDLCSSDLAVLGLEPVVLADAVAADPDDRGVDPGEVGHGVAKAAGLGGASGRVVARVEVQHHQPSLQCRQRNRGAALSTEEHQSDLQPLMPRSYAAF